MVSKPRSFIAVFLWLVLVLQHHDHIDPHVCAFCSCPSVKQPTARVVSVRGNNTTKYRPQALDTVVCFCSMRVDTTVYI